jgi:hypothetical protein
MKISVAVLVVSACAGLALTGCGGGSDNPPAANPDAATQAQDKVIDFGWSDGFHLPGATEWLDDKVCPEETPYLVNHDYAPLGTELATGVEIQQNSDPWAINVYAPMYASVPVDPNHAIELLNDGYLIGLHSWNLESDAGVIVNSVTHWGVAIGGEGHKYKILLHCTADTSRAAKGKYFPLHETSATKQQITHALAAEGADPMTLAQLKAARPPKN